ncbi:MAG TPA: response regulator [Anaerolineaceae bacterium]
MVAVQEKIRVLIVDDITETRENIRRMLQFDNQIEVAGTARTGAEAIDQSQLVKPDVIIMDINMPDMDGIKATEQIKRKLPYAQVVILSVQNDPNYMRRAMLAGARDFLTKPPNIDELTSAVRRAGEMAHEEKRKLALENEVNVSIRQKAAAKGKVIVVYSPKGGTGKTTLATNLAIGLHSEENKSILVDANMIFGDTTVFLNEQGKNSIVDLAQIADELDNEIVEDVLITHRTSGIRLLPPPPHPELSGDVSADQFGKVVDFLKQLFTYIIIDTPSYLSEIVSTCLVKADLIVLVTTQDIPAIRNSSQFLAIADSEGLKDRILFVMNRHDRRIGITPEKVGDSLKQPIVLTIPEEKLISTSVNVGVPFLMDNKGSPVGKILLNLVDIVRDRLAKIELAGAEPPPIKK